MIQRYRNIIMRHIYYNYLKNSTKLPFYPERLYLELTNVCNFQCIMCPNGKGLMKREKGFMDYELAKNIIDEMGPHTRTIVLHIWGESLLHPHIFDIIKYCHKYDIKTELSTNTSLLNDDVTNKIIESGLDTIYLCMDGITRETYERVRKTGDFDSTLKNIEDFLRIKKEKRKIGVNNPLVNIQIIVMKETQDEIEVFKNKWSVEGVDKIIFKPLDTWGGQISDINSLQIDNNGNDKNRNIVKCPRYNCPNLWYHAHIYWDGTMVCCDRDFDARNPLGNVQKGVMNAWNGLKMQDLRKRHLVQDLKEIQSCSNCTEWQWWKPRLLSYGNKHKNKILLLVDR